MKFTHLHLHTDFSLLDGVIQIPSLIEKLQATNMEACAITDHGNMYGAYKFINSMREAGLKPIIGSEVYIAPRSMDQKEFGIDNKYYHLVLLAKNVKGYKNLMKIVSLAHMKGFYYKPRIDYETLSKYTEGLIASTACLSGIISRPLANGNEDKALENLNKYRKIFKDDLYIEIQRNGLDIQKDVNKKLLSLAREYDLPIIATCDSHYLNKEDAELQEVLWAISEGKTLDDPTRRKMDVEEFYVKTPEEMSELFSDIPDAISNTQKIVEQIEDFDIDWGRTEPKYLDLNKGETPSEVLRDLTYDGAKEKYGEITDAIRERIDYELKIIDDKGYNDYFLIVWDFARFCRENGIVIGMRGSGCGSVVAYSIGITHVEPLKWKLYFERFLNYERASPPDFDIDVADDRRQELIDYTVEKFGEPNVKQIGTFSKLQTRQAIRDVARVLDIDLEIADRLSKMVDVVFGKASSMQDMMDNNQEFREIINSSPNLIRLKEIVGKINGVCRGVSTHACGFIVSPDPVMEYCPIQRDSQNEGLGMTQFEMADAEGVGLMKFDFLGLRNLASIGKTVDKVEYSTGERIDLLNIDFADEDTLETIRQGHTVGVFQMESSGMRKVINQIKPEDLEEICYLLAVYRPGPMEFIPDYVAVKEGRQQPDYIIDDLKPILEVTNGVITYQEQIMRIVQKLAGYTLGAASVVMKSMSKKKMKKVKKEKPKFIEGGLEKGYDKKDLEKVWERLLKFANYGFNKAHSSSYAHVSYWTAYLKTHYPLEFMASLLESDLDNFDRIAIDLEECKRLNIEVLPPNINSSYTDFSVEEGKKIRFGLGAIKNIGEDLCDLIVKERKENGDYLNLDDFLFRLCKHKISKRQIEYLIQAGSMDIWGKRDQLLMVMEDLYEKYKKKIKIARQGQMDLFSPKSQKEQIHIKLGSPLPEVPREKRISKYEQLQLEKELLGLYMSSHPLDKFDEFFAEKGVKKIKDLEGLKADELVILGCTISAIRRITTKKGDPMAFVSLEDKSGSIDTVVFPRTYEKIKEDLQDEHPILFAGKVNYRDGKLNLIAEKIKALDPKKHGSNFEGVTFKIKNVHSKEEIHELKKCIKDNPGDKAVRIISTTEEKVRVVKLKRKVVLNEAVRRLQVKFR